MTDVLVGLVSAKGSPGVTTSALALASQWPRAALVVEADPFGGDVRAGLGRGEWPSDAGIMEAVVDMRSMDLDVAVAWRLHRPTEYSPSVLAGLGCVGQASTLPWSRIGSALARLPGADVVADCGRFAVADGVTPLLRVCDVVVVVTGSSLRAVRAAARIAPRLQEERDVRPGDPRVPVLVVGADAPYPASEVAVACRLPLLGELPDDPRAAAVWSDGDQPRRGFGRSPLQREARRLAEALAASGDDRRGVA